VRYAIERPLMIFSFQSKFLSRIFIVLAFLSFIAVQSRDINAEAASAPPQAKHPSAPEKPASPHSPSVSPASSPSPHRPPSGDSVPFMQKLQGFKQKLEKNPKDVEALIFIANANFDIQRFGKAETFYLRALEVDGKNIHIRTDLASAYRQLGHSDKAVVALQIVLEINPNHEVALYNLGIILLNDLDDRMGAAEAWDRLVQINPDDPLADELRKTIKTIKDGKLKPN